MLPLHKTKLSVQDTRAASSPFDSWDAYAEVNKLKGNTTNFTEFQVDICEPLQRLRHDILQLHFLVGGVVLLGAVGAGGCVWTWYGQRGHVITSLHVNCGHLNLSTTHLVTLQQTELASEGYFYGRLTIPYTRVNTPDTLICKRRTCNQHSSPLFSEKSFNFDSFISLSLCTFVHLNITGL